MAWRTALINGLLHTIPYYLYVALKYCTCRQAALVEKLLDFLWFSFVTLIKLQFHNYKRTRLNTLCESHMNLHHDAIENSRIFLCFLMHWYKMYRVLSTAWRYSRHMNLHLSRWQALIIVVRKPRFVAFNLLSGPYHTISTKTSSLISQISLTSFSLVTFECSQTAKKHTHSLILELISLYVEISWLSRSKCQNWLRWAIPAQHPAILQTMKLHYAKMNATKLVKFRP